MDKFLFWIDPSQHSTADTIYKHLVAKKFHLKKSLESLSDWCRWRISFGVQRILYEEFPTEVTQNGFRRCGFYGADTNGRPIYFDRRLACDNVDGMSNSTSQSERQQNLMGLENILRNHGTKMLRFQLWGIEFSRWYFREKVLKQGASDNFQRAFPKQTHAVANAQSSGSGSTVTAIDAATKVDPRALVTSGSSVAIDLHGFSIGEVLSCPSLYQWAQECIPIIHEKYPLHIEKIYFLNVSPLMYAMWHYMLRPLGWGRTWMPAYQGIYVWREGRETVEGLTTHIGLHNIPADGSLFASDSRSSAVEGIERRSDDSTCARKVTIGSTMVEVSGKETFESLGMLFRRLYRDGIDFS